MVRFGQMLRLVRKDLDLTQTQLADAMGLPQTNVSAFERSESLNEATLERAASAMGLSLVAFLKLGIKLVEKPR